LNLVSGFIFILFLLPKAQANPKCMLSFLKISQPGNNIASYTTSKKAILVTQENIQKENNFYRIGVNTKNGIAEHQIQFNGIVDTVRLPLKKFENTPYILMGSKQENHFIVIDTSKAIEFSIYTVPNSLPHQGADGAYFEVLNTDKGLEIRALHHDGGIYQIFEI
jgi:hypothetical protein